MKKIWLVSVVVFCLPSLSFAQYWGGNYFIHKGKKSTVETQATKKVEEKVVQSIKEKQSAGEFVQVSGEVSLLRQYKDASYDEMFEKIKEYHPQEAKSVDRIAAIHNEIVKTANNSNLDNATICQALTYLLEDLYETFNSLNEKSPATANLVKIVLNHTYHFKPLGGSAKGLGEIKDEILTEFSAYNTREGERVGLRIGQNDYKKCEAWYDSFDGKFALK